MTGLAGLEYSLASWLQPDQPDHTIDGWVVLFVTPTGSHRHMAVERVDSPKSPTAMVTITTTITITTIQPFSERLSLFFKAGIAHGDVPGLQTPNILRICLTHKLV